MVFAASYFAIYPWAIPKEDINGEAGRAERSLE